MIEHRCDECALKNLAQGACPVFQADMSGQAGCPYFHKTLDTCELCGNIIIDKAVVLIEDEKAHYLCSGCANASPCAKCGKCSCAFETDRSCPEPPYIMKTQQQGNMIIQTQVLNPRRIDATCRKGCPCFYENELTKRG